MRRLLALFVLGAALCLAQTSYERLAATAKLWAYVKYFHTRVTAGDVDWDRAFANAAPKVLEAKTDAEFSAAVGEMLASLKDPATRLMTSSNGPRNFGNVLTVKHDKYGVTVVSLEPGDMMQSMQARNSFASKIAGVGPVVFDLCNSQSAPYAVPSSLPAAATPSAVNVMMRRHSGYSTPENFGSGGYFSSWEVRDGARLEPVANPIRAVFLVNSRTAIPLVALALQHSGDAAIVSEDEIGFEQMDEARRVRVLGNLWALVRTREIVFGDGSTAAGANVVLHKTGAAALQEAAQIAKSGNWPAAKQGPRFSLPSARFAENAYSKDFYPRPEYRMLAAARIWAVFHYFHPYRHLYGEDWCAVLTEFLPKMARAEDAREYHLAVAEMVAHTHDTHCFVGSPYLAEFFGAAPPPVEVRWIENRPVVTRVFDTGLADKVHPGDVVTKIDGAPFQKRVDELSAHISASTPQSMMNRVTQVLLNGADLSKVRVSLQTGSEAEREIELQRDSSNMALFRPSRQGDVFRLIKDRIGYTDLERLTNAQVDAMFEKLSNTDAIIMDMRGYPQGTAWSIAPRLGEKTSPVAAVFRRNLVSGDGVEGNDVNSFLFEQRIFEQRIPSSQKPRYRGKTVMLIDERAISQSEHSGLFYKAANGTMFIGSPTTGANGDVTYFQAPGGIRINFSGHDVRWPDGKQLQRVGLIPDIEVRPTIAGIRAGRDEVLERAVEYVEKELPRGR